MVLYIAVGDCMILYRDITYDEFEKLVGNKQLVENSGYDGMNFFKYGSHAKKYLNQLGQMIIKCDIPDYLIKEMDYIKFYPYSYFSVGVPIPEYIMRKKDFDNTFITEINPNINKDDSLFHTFLKERYSEWKKNNGNQFIGECGFYDYVLHYLNGRNLDDVILKYANSNKMLVRKKRK